MAMELTALHCYDPSHGHDKVYAVWIEDRGESVPRWVINGAYGKRSILTDPDPLKMLKIDPKGPAASLASARDRAASIIAEKHGKGYIKRRESYSLSKQRSASLGDAL
jgi:hypothetical protein